MAGEEQIVSGMAERYARAVFDLARESKAVDTVAADLTRFQNLIDGSQDLQRLVNSPVFSSDEQFKAVDSLLAREKLGGLAANFIRLVARNRRLAHISEMVRGFKALVDKENGKETADVTVAQPLSDENLNVLKESLNKATGKDVSLNVKVDPGLIGGLIVKIGSRMIDASLKTKLQSIKIAMKEVG